jgi:hypothetical protein
VADPNPSNPEKLLAFHWASFGPNQTGIHSTDLPQSDTRRVITRLEGGGRIQILSFTNGNNTIVSTAMQVKQKATKLSLAAVVETPNNSFIDCHLEVWTRFPVIPAVARTTLSVIDRQPRRITFACSTPPDTLQKYFAGMISTFEEATHKPIEGSLSAILVESTTEIGKENPSEISEYRLGSFIVELLCLIPLQCVIILDFLRWKH